MIVFRLTSVLAKMQLEIQNQAAETLILKYVHYTECMCRENNIFLIKMFLLKLGSY